MLGGDAGCLAQTAQTVVLREFPCGASRLVQRTAGVGVAPLGSDVGVQSGQDARQTMAAPFVLLPACGRPRGRRRRALFREAEHPIRSRRHYRTAREPPHRRHEHPMGATLTSRGCRRGGSAPDAVVVRSERTVDEQQTPGGSRPGILHEEHLPANPRAASARRALWSLVGLSLMIGMLVALPWLVEYVTVGQYLVHTDDAYVRLNEVPVRSAVPGLVRDLLVTDNQEIVAGQVLARIEHRDERAATVALNDVVAPVAGVVAASGLHVGDVVTADRPLMAVVTPGEPRVIAALSVSEITYVAIGQAVAIDVPSLPAVRLYGHVADAEWIDAVSGSPNGEDRIALKIDLMAVPVPAGLRSGMAVGATILTGLTGTERMVSQILQEKAQKTCRCEQDLQAASVQQRI
ncbi:HlyD family efflux transporter periplasmic adaptor subunit [Bradyrhizobium oligotrophicum]